MIDKDHGIVFFKKPMDYNTTYIEFHIIIIKGKGKSNLFIGLIDKTKYKLENLLSTYWKDSPSSLYWDVWNSKLIKTDEFGVQTSTIVGYGCSCEEQETKLGMLYCPLSRTLSFIKDGINQGVAFNDVQSGLYPSLDIWFEEGSIKVLSKSTYEDNSLSL